MKKCVICRNDILNEDPAVLFEVIEGNTNEICSNCEKQIDIMEVSEDIKEAKFAVNYLYTCYLSNGDEKVKEVLKNLLDVNSKDLINKEKEQASKNPVDITKLANYFIDNSYSETTNIGNWISILKIVTWIYVVFLSIASLAGIFTFGGLGVLTFIAYLLAILMFIAIVKIIVNMSEEVTEIKKMLLSIKNKDI